jgi:biotin carboxyl carrier protein
MEANFKVVVNKIYNFNLSGSDIGQFDMLTSNTTAHVISNHHSETVEILESDCLKRDYIIKVNGNRYSVHIENELDALISEMGLSLTDHIETSEIEAPMPGLIIDVIVEEGQEVKKGDFLCVLEAMKMENTLLSPRDGVIKTIKIEKGQTVDKGAVLIEFEK